MTESTEQKDKDFSKFRHEIVDSGFFASLSNAAIRVYLVILRHADYKEGWSYPTVETITRESGVNKNCIAKAIRELAEKGLIEKNKTGKNFSFRNIYRVIKSPKTLSYVNPKNTDKCKHTLRGKDGRFKPIPKNRDNSSTQNTEDLIPKNKESDTIPESRDKKENLETIFRDKTLEKTDETPSEEQTPPITLEHKKSLKDVSRETLQGFIKEKDLHWLRDYLLKQGYDEEEIENLNNLEGFEDKKDKSTEREKTTPINSCE